MLKKLKIIMITIALFISFLSVEASDPVHAEDSIPADNEYTFSPYRYNIERGDGQPFIMSVIEKKLSPIEPEWLDRLNVAGKIVDPVFYTVTKSPQGGLNISLSADYIYDNLEGTIYSIIVDFKDGKSGIGFVTVSDPNPYVKERVDFVSIRQNSDNPNILEVAVVKYASFSGDVDVVITDVNDSSKTYSYTVTFDSSGTDLYRRNSINIADTPFNRNDTVLVYATSRGIERITEGKVSDNLLINIEDTSGDNTVITPPFDTPFNPIIYPDITQPESQNPQPFNPQIFPDENITEAVTPTEPEIPDPVSPAPSDTSQDQTGNTNRPQNNSASQAPPVQPENTDNSSDNQNNAPSVSNNTEVPTNQTRPINTPSVTVPVRNHSNIVPAPVNPAVVTVATADETEEDDDETSDGTSEDPIEELIEEPDEEIEEEAEEAEDIELHDNDTVSPVAAEESLSPFSALISMFKDLPLAAKVAIVLIPVLIVAFIILYIFMSKTRKDKANSKIKDDDEIVKEEE